MQFGSQDFWLTQPQNTLAYAKALQHWVEKAQPPTPGKSHQLVGSVLELWCMMEVLTTFTNEEVLEDTPPSNWVKITLSKLAEPAQRECSHSRTHWAHARGSFLAAYGEGWPQATAITQRASQQAAPAQEVMPQQAGSSSQCPIPPPGFVEIAWSLHGDNPPRVVAGIHLELAEDQGPIQMVGSFMLSAMLFRDVTSGPCVLTWWCVQWTWWVWDLIPWWMTAMSLPSEKKQIWTRYPTMYQWLFALP